MIALALGFTTAGAAEHKSKVGAPDGEHNRALGKDLVLLGRLDVQGEKPIRLYAGLPPGLDCTQADCDPESSVFFVSPKNEPATGTSLSWRYPGDYYTSESGTLAARVRMFIGRCLDSREVVVWFVKREGASATRVDSIWSDQVIVGSVIYVPQIGGLYSEANLTDKLPDIANARAATIAGTCREIPPQARIERSADSYVPEAGPRFRTDCSTAAFDPRDVPLAPGPPGKPLSYFDKRTDTQLYVESDGRHLAALKANELLWVRNPFVDQNMCPYRTERPIISQVGPLTEVSEADIARLWKREGPFIEIHFNSSQFGVVDLTNGDFYFGGQN